MMKVNNSFRILFVFEVKLRGVGDEICQKIVKEVSTVVKIKQIVDTLQDVWANQVFIL